MKKVLAVMAVLAVAAAAQAELLANWNFDTANGSTLEPIGTAVNAGQVTFGNLSRVNGLQTATTRTYANFSANTWTASGGDFDNGKAGLGFTVAVASGYEIADSFITSPAANAGNTGPADLQWSLNGSDVGAAWSLTTSAASGQQNSTADSKFTVPAGDNTMLLYASSTSGAKSGSSLAATGRADFNTKISFDGTIQPAGSAVPEPATMSLLGLGALAMALRRKLRK